MQDATERRRLVLNASIQTIAKACRHLYQEEIDSAKAAGDVIAVVRAKAAMQKDWDAWTAPLQEALDALDKPPLIIVDAAS